MVKRFVFLISLFFSGITVLHSQSVNEGINLGIHSLLGHSTVSPHNYQAEDLDNKFFFAFSLGLQGGLRFSERVSLFAEYNFSRLGSRWSGTADSLNIEKEVRVEYWQIPVLVRYMWPGKPTFFVTGGPQLNILKTGTFILEFKEPNGEVTGSDITESLSNTTFGVVLGAAVRIDFTQKLYGVLGTRFSYTISDIHKAGYRLPDSDGQFPVSHLYYPALDIGLGYIFGQY